MNQVLSIITQSQESDIKYKLYLIDLVLQDKKIDFETVYNKEGKNLYDFIKEKYIENPINQDMINFMSKYNLKIKIEPINYYESIFKLMTKANSFDKERELLQFIKNNINKEDFIAFLTPGKKMELFYRLFYVKPEKLITTWYSDFFKDFLGESFMTESMKEFLIKNKEKKSDYLNKVFTVLLKNFPELQKINIGNENIINFLLQKNPTFVYDTLLKDGDIDKEPYLENYFNNKFATPNPNFSYYEDTPLLLSKNKWFKIKTNQKNKDILDFLISKKELVNVIFMALKNFSPIEKQDFFDFLDNREKNIYVSYLESSIGVSQKTVAFYEDMSQSEVIENQKEFKVLMKKLNIDGVKNHKEGFFYSILKIKSDIKDFFAIPASCFDFYINEVPPEILFSSNSKNLLKLINECGEVFVGKDMISLKAQKRSAVINIMIDYVEKSDFEDKKEILLKLDVIKKTQELINTGKDRDKYNRFERLKSIISTLPTLDNVSDISNFSLLDKLMLIKELPEDYKKELCVMKENIILQKTIKQNFNEELSNDKKIKKRI